MIDLAGAWRLTDASGDYACAISLPCDGITALHDAGLIADPYFGRNEYDLRWICERDWTVSRTVVLNDVDVELVLSGLDTVCTVALNGITVLQSENAFRTYRIALGDAARVGENELTITFHSSVAAGKAKADAHPFEIPWSWNCPIPYGNMLRKPAMDFGWDWNLALAPFGVYGLMEIQPATAARIDRVMVGQTHEDGAATVSLSAHVVQHDGDVTFEMAGQTLTAAVENGVASIAMRLENPDLWWPVGQGEQPLYDLTVTAGTAVEIRKIGLRSLDLITEKDDIGLGFKFRVNGRDVFCKGANWIPADALAGRITPEKTRDLLQSAIDANMNMIRIWGGGRYEDTWFYDLCDEMGLMVWQDFMFACNLYPSDRTFLADVRAEVIDNVARMNHHACIAVWCGDNELIGALSWYDCSKKDRDRYLVNYDRLNRCIEDALLDTDPNATWWPSSPSPGPMNFGDAWHDDTSGDMHFWSVWHEGRDFDHYRDVGPRFCSEFGFQSYPSMNAVRKFADPKDQNIAAPVLEAHQKNEGGNARIAETMFRYFRWPEKFEDFVYLSQVQQGLAIKTAVTHWRSLKPRCMGTLIWQLNDTWPVCSWASLDHGGDWKLMHHMARDFFADVLVTAVPLGDKIIVRAINDTPDVVSVNITARAVHINGTLRELNQATVDVNTDAVDAITLNSFVIAADEMLVLDWTSAQGNNREVYAPQPYKTYDLLPPQIDMTVVGNDITLTAKGLALFTAIEADVAGRFSQNVFDMLPGETITTTFSPANPTDTPQFTLRDLYSATTA